MKIEGSDWCQVCGQQTPFAKDRINHVLHLLLSVVTLGVWLPVWATLGWVNSVRMPRCVHCGAKLGTKLVGQA